jgi:copper chaperone CopZ
MSSGENLEVRIGGMSCGGCVRGVARAFEKAGLEATQVQVGSATLKGSPSLDAVRAALEGAGFQLLGAEAG